MSVAELRAWARGFSTAVDETIGAFSRELVSQERKAEPPEEAFISKKDWDTTSRGHALLNEIVVALELQVTALDGQRPATARAGRRVERDIYLTAKIEALREAIGTAKDIATYVLGLPDNKLFELIAKQNAAKAAKEGR
jgi:hypothetical protein